MLNGKRYTVINTDAGIKGNVSAWGFWIRSENVRIIRCKKFKVHIDKDSDKAEISAILNALHMFAKMNILERLMCLLLILIVKMLLTHL
jgi:ribonuclease HI